MNIFQYQVFAAASNGGKKFALLDTPVPQSEMPNIARQSGAALTAFVAATEGVSAQFFNADGKEKPESDSGALVVAQHLGRNCVVKMRGGDLAVELEDGTAWVRQGNHNIFPLPGLAENWLAALAITQAQLLEPYTILCAGNSEKQNLIVPVLGNFLDDLQPDFAKLAELSKLHSVNGAIVVALDSQRGDVDFRFFAPHKGLFEDNAGSCSLASICGYLAAHRPSGLYQLTAAQGYAMQKPSKLFARYVARDSVALAVQVGGTVQKAEAFNTYTLESYA